MVNTLIRTGIRENKGTLIGVFVAVLTATMLATGLGVLIESGSRGGVDPERYTAADVIVGGAQSFETPENATYSLPERVPLPADALSAIRGLPDVERVVVDMTVPLSWDGSPIEAHSWSSASLTPYEISDGRAPRAADEVVIERDAQGRPGCACRGNPGRRQLRRLGIYSHDGPCFWTHRVKPVRPTHLEGRTRKTPADVAREALVAAGLRAPNQREFGINDPYAWELFRPEPSMLPPFPPCWLPGVARDQK